MYVSKMRPSRQVVKLAAGMAPRSAAGSPDTMEGGMRVLSDAMSCSGRAVANPLKLVKQEVRSNFILCRAGGGGGGGCFILFHVQKRSHTILM